ncbi:hypothetical protein OIU83_08260 [Flavobacterium sp. LS1R49]|uniref:Uncharacterized protein n=1 Tax=Flavobacterium shii TaxID=2987687 RepID=A0A9X2ZB31_9FLAO|nr:hypothetical protein [Flavobacterium shii]MCV9927639.1 hypothetical protein [Flavobacterium shii]
MNISNFQKYQIIILTVIVSFSFQSCLVSRCKRPRLIGYIYDESTNKPIESCKVGESLTNSAGYFDLKEIRYSQFTFVAFEAPPLSVNEPIYKEGYEKKSINFLNPFSGGMRKGAIQNMDTIYLKKVVIPVSN